uniref:Uncharacterized protein n=1 Tax=Oryza glumipatula TaxID=40148 RepID=A0A0D9ZWG5_9ORYZ
MVLSLAAHHRIADGQATTSSLARELGTGGTTTTSTTTRIRITVNGRVCIRLPVPRDYFGNLVLWAFPRCDAGELVTYSVHHAAELIHRAVAGIDDTYFRLFIDFASFNAIKAEGLGPTADAGEVMVCPG